MKTFLELYSDISELKVVDKAARRKAAIRMKRLTKTSAFKKKVEKSKLKVAGGGSTVASINHYKASDYFSHISTGGGAFLRLLEGKFLEGIEVLKDE